MSQLAATRQDRRVTGYKPVYKAQSDTGAGPGMTWEPIYADEAPAAKVDKTNYAPQDQITASATGGDVAYTGGDANALDAITTMQKKRGAAAQRLLGSIA